MVALKRIPILDTALIENIAKSHADNDKETTERSEKKVSDKEQKCHFQSCKMKITKLSSLYFRTCWLRLSPVRTLLKETKQQRLRQRKTGLTPRRNYSRSKIPTLRKNCQTQARSERP